MFNIGLAYEVPFSSLSPMVTGRQDHTVEPGRRQGSLEGTTLKNIEWYALLLFLCLISVYKLEISKG